MSRRIDAIHEAGASASALLTRRDAGSVWESAITGMPTGEQLSRYSANPTITPGVAEGLVLHDWRARREILQPARDLVREGVELEGLPEWVDAKAVQSWLEGESEDGESCGLLPALGELWAEGETYGGAILVAVADDGVPSSEPIQLRSLRDVVSWEVLDRYSVWPYRSKGLSGPVDYWSVVDYSGGGHGMISAIVHPSRVAVHWGSWMPKRWRRFRNGWGCSRLELLRDQRDNLAVAMANLGRLLAKASTDVLTVAELSEMIDIAGAGVLRGKMAQVMEVVAAMGYIVLDGGIEAASNSSVPGRSADKFESVARNLGGASDVPETTHQDWRRGSGMPEMIADGQLAGGLHNGEGAGPWRAWGAAIAAEQVHSLTRKLVWGLKLGFAAKEGPTKGKDPGPYTVNWVDIAEPDREYEAQVSLLEAQADEIQIRSGTIASKESRQHRNVDGQHGPVKVESADMLPESDDDSIAAEIEGAGAAESVQALVLNGAQMAALLEITASVTSGSLPSEVAVWLIGLSVPGLPTGPAANALAVAEAWGRANPGLQAAPPQGLALDAAVAMVRVFDIHIAGRHDAETVVGRWALALQAAA
jgi:hypothetical protein